MIEAFSVQRKLHVLHAFFVSISASFFNNFYVFLENGFYLLLNLNLVIKSLKWNWIWGSMMNKWYCTTHKKYSLPLTILYLFLSNYNAQMEWHRRPLSSCVILTSIYFHENYQMDIFICRLIGNLMIIYYSFDSVNLGK